MPLVIMSFPGFIWVRWRDRRPSLLLSIAKPGHPAVHILVHIAVCFPACEFPRPPSQTLLPTLWGQKVDSDEDARLGMNTVTNWSLGLVNASLHSHGAVEEIAKCSHCKEINRLYRPPPSPSTINLLFIWMLFIWLDYVFPLNWQSVSILWGEETGEGIWLEIWLWVFFNKFSENLKKDLLKKISVNYLLLL